MLYLGNAFSLNMLEAEGEQILRITPINGIEAAQMLRAAEFESVVGHPTTAAVLAQRLGIKVEANRTTLTLQPGDVLLVAQITMPRLAEGQVLSESEVAGLPIRYFLIGVAAAGEE